MEVSGYRPGLGGNMVSLSSFIIHNKGECYYESNLSNVICSGNKDSIQIVTSWGGRMSRVSASRSGRSENLRVTSRPCIF